MANEMISYFVILEPPFSIISSKAGFEWGDAAWNLGISNNQTVADNFILEKRYLTHFPTILRVF